MKKKTKKTFLCITSRNIVQMLGINFNLIIDRTLQNLQI